MIQDSDRSTPTLWARFRFSVVGALLSSPPAHGELKAALQALASKTWTHPVSGREVQFSAPTIARWYYTARHEKDDPVRVLRRAVRKDCGRVSLAPALAEHLFRQYRDYEHWTYPLHYDNLAARVKADPSLAPLRSYSTVRRYMQAHGLLRKRGPGSKRRPGEEQAARRRERREVRSYEAEYVGSLWHLDFHHGSLKVLTSRGQWQRPLALGILDDHSRLCCHLQWYLSETISLEGVRFEFPARYRHFRDVAVRYARWDLGRVDLVDPRQGTILTPLYPLDRQANGDGQRLLFPLDTPGVAADGSPRADRPDDQQPPGKESSPPERPEPELPPLLKQILADYSATAGPCSGSWTCRSSWCITPGRTRPPAWLPAKPSAAPVTCTPSATPTST